MAESRSGTCRLGTRMAQQELPCAATFPRVNSQWNLSFGLLEPESRITLPAEFGITNRSFGILGACSRLFVGYGEESFQGIRWL